MKTLFFITVIFCLNNYCFAQVDLNYQDRGYTLDIYDNSGNKLPVDGYILSNSPFLNPEWGTGSVILNNGQQFSGLNLQFDIENNTLYFKKDTSVYAFAAGVSAFTMKYNNGKDEKEVLFKSGYPDRKGNPSNFLYQVLSDGPNVQFLKYLKVNIDEHYNYGLAVSKSYSVHEDLYLFDVKSQKLTKIKNSEESIAAVLPQYKEDIQKFTETNNYNYKDDKEIAALTTSLNYVK